MDHTEKLYNIQNVYELASGDQSFVKRLLTIFITETPITLGEMFDANLKGDTETLKKLAHRIKPSIKNLDIKSIIGDLNDIEMGIDPHNTDQKLKRISGILIEVIMGLSEELEEQMF